MKGPVTKLVHALTDLCLGVMVGVSVGASVAASVIFGVSREQSFPKDIANTLAGSMFDRLGWPMVILAVLAMLGCLVAVKHPPLTGLATRKTTIAWRVMGGVSVLIFAGALATQFYFAPLMADLRANSTWVDGELADAAERAAFASAHGWSMAVSGVATLLAAGLVVARRLFTGAGPSAVTK